MKKQIKSINNKSIFNLLFLTLVLIGCTESNILDGIRDVKFKATVNRLLLSEGETIIYKDSSAHVVSRLWTFEGGNISSSDQQEVSVTYPTESPFSGTASNRISDGFSSTLEVTYDDNTTEKNTFKVHVYPKVIADFKADKNTALFGTPIQFTDITLEGQSSFEEARKEDTILWEFEGGNPATSTERNPIVTYSTPGNYSVTLTVGRSVPTSKSTTEKKGFITIQSAVAGPYCSDPLNLVGCGNNDGEEADLSDWEILDNVGGDLSANFSVSNTRFSAGTGSLKHIYDETGNPTFTNNTLKFKEKLIKVDVAADYTVSLDAYADILSAGSIEFVAEVTFEKVGGESVTPKPFFRKGGNTWQTLSATQNLAPGDYFIQIKIWNPGFNIDLKYDLYLDEIKVIKN
ncbi:PKD domain-containing protein [Polaribacter atrinae]|uniref:PKD domain-containing protein n=1 Tax=Polaribacter atrinae TaxID=1333662 RepID=UPI0030F9E625